jgi:hypothetical protein
MDKIAELRGIDRTRFEQDVVSLGRPVIMRGLVTEWPWVAAGAKCPERIRAAANHELGEVWFAPPGLNGRFGFDDEFEQFNHDRKRATIAQLLDLLERQRGDAAPYGMFAGALPVARHLPGFRAEHPIPLLDESREMLVSLWLGNQTQTAAHFDFPDNLACVIAGRRRFTLFPPEQVDNLYIGPLDVTLAGQPSSLVDVEAPDLIRFPRFAEAADAALVAELGPGDVLYIPSLWWHAVRSLDEIGAMVNYWWRTEGLGAGPYAALLHAAATMHVLPARERTRWKALFDHFAFSADPDAHLPEHVRGSGMTDDVRQRIIRSLGGRP